jgi:hypothetical protein
VCISFPVGKHGAEILNFHRQPRNAFVRGQRLRLRTDGELLHCCGHQFACHVTHAWKRWKGLGRGKRAGVAVYCRTVPVEEFCQVEDCVSETAGVLIITDVPGQSGRIGCQVLFEPVALD